MSSLSFLDFLEQMGDFPRPFSRSFDVADEEDDDDDEEYGIPKIRVGICAMSKKVTSRFKLKYTTFDILKFSWAARPRQHKQRKLNVMFIHYFCLHSLGLTRILIY